jgi:Arc/MetJ family transcription regulator
MTEAIKATGARTKKEAVEVGLRTVIRLKKQERIRGFRGKLPWMTSSPLTISDSLNGNRFRAMTP